MKKEILAFILLFFGFIGAAVLLAWYGSKEKFTPVPQEQAQTTKYHFDKDPGDKIVNWLAFLDLVEINADRWSPRQIVAAEQVVCLGVPMDVSEFSKLIKRVTVTDINDARDAMIRLYDQTHPEEPLWKGAKTDRQKLALLSLYRVPYERYPVSSFEQDLSFLLNMSGETVKQWEDELQYWPRRSNADGETVPEGQK